MPDGSRYDGGWKDDRPNGYGTLIIEARRFEGEWREGKKHVRISKRLNI